MKRKIWTFIRAIFAVSGKKSGILRMISYVQSEMCFKTRDRQYWIGWLCLVSVKYRWSVGQVSSSIGQVSAKYRWPKKLCRPTYMSVDCRSTVDRVSIDSRSPVGRLSMDSRPSVDRVSTEEKVDGKALRTRLVLISISGSRACLICAFPSYSCWPYYPRAWNRLQY